MRDPAAVSVTGCWNWPRDGTSTFSRNRRPLPPYSEDEWQRLTAVCRQQVDDSYATHRRALASVRRRAASGRGCVVSPELLLAVVDARPDRQQRRC